MDNPTLEIAAVSDAANRQDEAPEGGAAQPSRSYADALTELLARADEAHRSEEFVDALVRTLAWIVFRYDRGEVTGDILCRLGRHLREFDQRRRAQQELEALREEGRALN